jgi:hypothetical protein
MRHHLVVGAAVLAVACGSDASSRTAKKAPAARSSNKPAVDAGNASAHDGGANAPTYERIIEGTWTLAPGTENPNFCVKKPLTEDVYVHAIRPVNPLGTHHTLLTIGDENDQCLSAVAAGFIYAAGVGSEGIVLPPGVALKLPAGKVLNLGLHIYNTGSTELTGTSAMEVVTMDANDVVYESDSLLQGPVGFSLPAHEQTTISGDCTVSVEQHVYALFPHMHQLGTHIKTSVTLGGVPMVLHDGDYTFNEQFQIPMDPEVTLSPGDSVHTECTYDNTTDRDTGFGESSDTEMCFSVLFRYPKQPKSTCLSAVNGSASQ